MKPQIKAVPTPSPNLASPKEVPSKLPLGSRLKLNDTQAEIIQGHKNKINELVAQLGHLRAQYLSTQEAYKTQRRSLEQSILNNVVAFAKEMGIVVDSNGQKWEFNQDTFEFERTL